MDVTSLPIQTPWLVKQLSDDLDLPELVVATDKLQVSSNIGSLYSYVSWVVRLDPAYVTKGYFATGKKFEFSFGPTDHREFCVLRCVGSPTAQTQSIPDKYEVVLVSPWYFEQTVGSKIYYGSVSQVLDQIVSNEKFSFKNKTLESGIDIANKRYQTLQTEGSFIENRVKEYYTSSDRSPSFIFVNDQHEFVATNESAILSMPARSYAISIESPSVSVFNDIFQEYDKFSRLLKLRFISFSYNKNDKLWPASNAAIAYTTPNGQIKHSTSEPFVGTFRPGQFLPVVVEKDLSIKQATSIYIDDSCQNYSDILARAQNEVMTNIMMGQGWVLAGDLNTNLKVGTPIDIYVEDARITGDETYRSVFAQTMVIVALDHKLSGLKGQTIATCAVSSFSYSDPEQVIPYYKTPLPQ